MAPFKNALIQKMLQLTTALDIQSPVYEKLIEWISEAWTKLDINMIASSFQLCGITTIIFESFHIIPIMVS